MRALEDPSFPTETDEAYHQIVIRITKSGSNSAHLAFRTLSWIFHSRRRLRVDELVEAISVDPDDASLNKQRLERLNVKEIVNSCKSFITFQEITQEIGFSHETVNAYFVKIISSAAESPLKAHLLYAPIELARTCITYLGFREFEEPCPDESLGDRLAKHKFSAYAAQYWGSHTAGVAEHLPDIQKLTLAVFGCDGKRNSMLQMAEYCVGMEMKLGHLPRKPNLVRTNTLLHILAENGLEKICEVFLYGSTNNSERYLSRSN
jgi:hypothetical protein